MAALSTHVTLNKADTETYYRLRSNTPEDGLQRVIPETSAASPYLTMTVTEINSVLLKIVNHPEIAPLLGSNPLRNTSSPSTPRILGALASATKEKLPVGADISVTGSGHVSGMAESIFFKLHLLEEDCSGQRLTALLKYVVNLNLACVQRDIPLCAVFREYSLTDLSILPNVYPLEIAILNSPTRIWSNVRGNRPFPKQAVRREMDEVWLSAKDQSGQSKPAYLAQHLNYNLLELMEGRTPSFTPMSFSRVLRAMPPRKDASAWNPLLSAGEEGEAAVQELTPWLRGDSNPAFTEGTQTVTSWMTSSYEFLLYLPEIAKVIKTMNRLASYDHF